MFYDLLTSALPYYYLGSQTMIILFGFLTISFISSVFVVAACALSARLRSDEMYDEVYDYAPDVTWETSPHTSAQAN